MGSFLLKDLSVSTDRYKLYSLMCNSAELTDSIAFIESHNIKVINIGKDLANYIDSLEDYKYLNIDAYDFTKKLLENNKAKIHSTLNIFLHFFDIILNLLPFIK